MAMLTLQQKRLRSFVYIFFGILLIAGSILYFGFFRKPTTPSPLVTSGISGYQLNLDIKRIGIDWAFLENQVVKDLKFFGEHPVEPGDKSRANPFLPI